MKNKDIIEEVTTVGNIEKGKWLGDGENATKLSKGSGPESASDLNEPIEGNDGDDENAQYLNKISQRIQKKSKKKGKKKGKKPGKTINDSINICDMKNNGSNIFDKLYSVIMEDDDLPAEFDSDIEDELGGLDGEEDFGDEGDFEVDEVTVSLPREVLEQLHDALTAALGGDEEGDEIEDLEDLGDDEFGGEDDLDEFDEMSFREGVNLGTVKTDGNPSALKDGVPTMQNKNNKVKGKASQVKSGKANTGTVKTDGDPKELADGVGKLTGKSNKVGDKGKHIGD